MLCGCLDGKRVWGRMDTCIYIAESVLHSPKTTTTLLIDYTPIQNVNFGKKNTISHVLYAAYQHHALT